MNFLKKLFKKKQVLDEKSFDLFFEAHDLVGTVLYIDEKFVGLVVRFEQRAFNCVNIIVDPTVNEFIMYIDCKTNEISTHQIYETSEFKENWIVDETFSMVSCYRHFRIQK